MNNAADTFGSMMDYSVNVCGLDGGQLLHMFTVSGLAAQFEHGNAKFIAGMSGVEQAMKAITDITGETPTAPAPVNTDFRTPEFWAGWALCQYQWHCARSFAAILRSFPFAEIVASCHPLHEADITRFYAVAERRYAAANPQTNLKRLRETFGLSQSQLAEKSGVTPRSIQMHEQRNQDTTKPRRSPSPCSHAHWASVWRICWKAKKLRCRNRSFRRYFRVSSILNGNATSSCDRLSSASSVGLC